MSATATDLNGREVKTGDMIAYSASNGNQSALRIGEVLDVFMSRPNYFGESSPKVRIKVTKSSGWGGAIPAKPVVIHGDTGHFVVIDK